MTTTPDSVAALVWVLCASTAFITACSFAYVRISRIHLAWWIAKTATRRSPPPNPWRRRAASREILPAMAFGDDPCPDGRASSPENSQGARRNVRLHLDRPPTDYNGEDHRCCRLMSEGR